ncbi:MULTISPECIES: ABC transporter substrate-binding protein [unclassified Agarivorans]|uniref:ABC transporter substrate-binding protein n=1 Tax=unclassified Agarivorans TaxID=2636026 RepID=UPI003D7C76F4
MMKKTLLATLTALTLGAMTASAYAQTELRMSWWGGNSRHQATLKAIEKFHEKYPDIVVKGEYTGWSGHLSRLTTQVAGNTEPDVMQTNWNWLPIFSKNGTGFYDMNGQAGALHLDNFPKTALNMTTIDGKINGLPVSITSRVFYYNKDSWAKAGVDYPKTWEDFKTAGQAFKAKLGADYFPLVVESRDVFAINRSIFIQKYGKDIINHDSNLLDFSQKEMTEFFQVYVDMVENHVFPSTKQFASYGKGNMNEMRPWIDGHFGGLYMWNTSIKKYANNLAPPQSMELGPYPMAPGATDSGLLTRPSMMFSIGRNTKHPEAAAKLVNFLLNDPEGVKAMADARGVPLSKSGLKTLKDAGLDTNSLPFQGYTLAQELPVDVLPTPYTDNAQLMELFAEEMQHLDYGQSTPAEAAKNFLRKGNRVLSRISK